MTQCNQVFTLSHRSSGAETDHQSCPGWGSVSLHTLTVIRYGLPSKGGVTLEKVIILLLSVDSEGVSVGSTLAAGEHVLCGVRVKTRC